MILRRLIYSALCATALLFSLSANALEPNTFVTDLQFEQGAVALNATQRSRVGEMISHFPLRQICWTITAEAYTDESEGSELQRDRLARARAAYVAELVGRLGRWRIFAGPGRNYFPRPKGWRGIAEVEAVGWPGNNCEG